MKSKFAVFCSVKSLGGKKEPGYSILIQLIRGEGILNVICFIFMFLKPDYNGKPEIKWCGSNKTLIWQRYI